MLLPSLVVCLFRLCVHAHAHVRVHKWPFDHLHDYVHARVWGDSELTLESTPNPKPKTGLHVGAPVSVRVSEGIPDADADPEAVLVPVSAIVFIPDQVPVPVPVTDPSVMNLLCAALCYNMHFRVHATQRTTDPSGGCTLIKNDYKRFKRSSILD